MELKPSERIDYVNDSLKLIQNEDGLTFGTDALLLAGYVSSKFNIGTELGGGSGIISMLLLTRDKVKSIRCLEIQEEYAELIGRNAEFNGLSDRLFPVLCDVREYVANGDSDIVFTNPPYMKDTSGAKNICDKKNIARHEVHGSVGDFLVSASKMLKFGGAFYVVYRQDRLIDLIYSMRKANIEPKRMTFVHGDENSVPSMVLIEGKKGAKSGLKVTKPLLIYRDKEHREYTDDMNYIMDFGSFPKEFLK